MDFQAEQGLLPKVTLTLTSFQNNSTEVSREVARGKGALGLEPTKYLILSNQGHLSSISIIPPNVIPAQPLT